MWGSCWFVLPIAAFLILSLYRITVAVAVFDPNGSMSSRSFDIVSNSLLSVETFGAVLAAAVTVFGGDILRLPAPIISLVAAIAIVFTVGALAGFYLNLMVPKYYNSGDKEYRFPNSLYPCVKGVFGAAQFVALASVAALVFYTVGRVQEDLGDVDSDAGPPAMIFHQ